MIKRVDVLVSFPMGAEFRSNLDHLLYRELIRFIYDLSCFNVDSKCLNCEKCKECRYFEITGENFKYYPGIAIKSEVFPKLHFKQNEEKKFSFYFIGNNTSFSDYVDLLFHNLNQTMYGNMFYLKTIEKFILESKNITLNSICLYTPIENKSLSMSYNDMVQYYNTAYGTSYSLLKDHYEIDKERYMNQSCIYLKTKKIHVKGYIGKVNGPICLNTDLIELGIGQFNFVGGGRIENSINFCM